MITVTNPKVAGFAPVWAAFRGFSLLFDNPGHGLTPMQGSPDFLTLDCDCSDPQLKLYRAFVAALQDMGQLVNTYLFCPLPSPSYHVTAWDGLNDRNVQNVSLAHRSDAQNLLKGLPDSLSSSSRFTTSSSGDALAMTMDCNIVFRFWELDIWGNSALVARLTLDDEDSEPCYQRIEAQRSWLGEEFRKRFGVTTRGRAFSPHVTLGYFANKEGGELATPQIDSWTDIVKDKVGTATINFESVGLYGFTDMATYLGRRQRLPMRIDRDW